MSVELYMDSESVLLYDKEHPLSLSDKDLEYYLDCCKKEKGNILELACGTGRLLIPALEGGCNIDGLDLSPYMLDILKEKLKQKNIETSLYQQNMANFSIEKKYDLIIIAATSFLILSQQKLQMDCLKCCHNHLSVGGKVVLDFMLDKGGKNEETFKFFRRISLENKQQILVQIASIRDNLHRNEELLYKYEVYSDKGVLKETFIRSLPWRSISIEEFELMAKQVGFLGVEFFGGFSSMSPTSSDSEIVAVLSK